MAAMFRRNVKTALAHYAFSLGKISQTAKCRAFLTAIEAFDHHDEAYTLTNIKNWQIVWHHNLKRWLEQNVKPKTTLPFDQTSGYVHSFIRPWYEALLAAAVMAFKDIDTRALKFRFVITVPMRRADGSFSLVKMIAMPLDYDDQKPKRRIGTLIQSFFVVGPYRGEPVALELYENEKRLGEKVYKSVQQHLLGMIKAKHSLTPLQTDMIHVIRSLKQANLKVSNQSIAARLKGAKGQIETAENVRSSLKLFKARLLELMDHDVPGLIDPPFFLYKARSLDVIDYFEDCGLISLLEAHSSKGLTSKVH